VRVEPDGHGLYVHPSINTLKRVYVELTNKCNLTCSTCMRNVWNVKYGRMSAQVFERVLSGLDGCDRKPELFLGGYGEPLSHPEALEMIALARSRGFQVSLITNGILLTEEASRKLIDL
jgi:MoaA/NifB/PqqE/SkfB family radical SAM enzyme